MRVFDQSPRVPGSLAGLAVLALALASCGRTAAPVAPSSERVTEAALRADLAQGAGRAGGEPGANLLYPLELGNHWGYDHSFATFFVPTGGPPGPVFGSNDRVSRDLVCVQELLGRAYTVEQVQYEGTPPYWVRYRQDGSGLFEADVDVTVPPSCGSAAGRHVFDAGAAPARRSDGDWASVVARAADPAQQAAVRAAWARVQSRMAAVRQAIGFATRALPRAQAGVEPGEIARLEYPLHTGAHWVMRSSPLFNSVVEGHDALDLQVGHVPAWRIRIESELFGSDDRVHLWYGRSGVLRFEAHLEGIATDSNGIEIGRVIADESEVLTELALSGGRFAAP